MAFSIDFIEAGQVSFRLYYQDAPSRSRWDGCGGRDGRTATWDVALLNGGNFDAVNKPERVVGNLRARNVVIHHWENFFDPTHQDQSPITDINAFRGGLIEEMGGDARRVRLLKPGVTIGF